ncbi:Thymocyte Nuclear Protein 1 [Manis pentadactyla]|nr:Thymocyte Nuclear Protein 1 [Manis pentadactyla]
MRGSGGLATLSSPRATMKKARVCWTGEEVWGWWGQTWSWKESCLGSRRAGDMTVQKTPSSCNCVYDITGPFLLPSLPILRTPATDLEFSELIQLPEFI